MYRFAAGRPGLRFGRGERRRQINFDENSGGGLSADSGEIIYKGQLREQATAGEIIDSGISIIYQELALVAEMSVAENIFLGREPRRALGILNLNALHRRAAALLKRLGIRLNTRLPISELTVAQRQLVEIAKALSQDADLIVMDEPSAILAGNELDQLFQIIESLVEQGVTIIYISHRLEEVFRIADEVTVLKDGELVDTRPITQLDRATLVEMMVGRPLDEIFPRTQHEQGELVLVAKDIATDTILDGASLELYAGEILGVAGMVGSGRTELARALFGADPLTSGSITLVGKGGATWSNPAQAIQSGLVLVPEDRKAHGLFTALSVRINVTIPILRRLTRFGIVRGQEERKSSSALANGCPSSWPRPIKRRNTSAEAINRKSCWPNGWRPTRPWLSSTNRRAA